MKRSCKSRSRRGAVVVEAALVLPLLLTLMLGVWELGRIVQVYQILNNAAREGARLAAGGYVNGTPVTGAMVQQATLDYMTAAGLPATAVGNAQVTLTCQASPTWTDPYKALPLDKYQVSVVIPAGTAFDSLRWNLLNQITSVRQMSVVVNWESLNNTVIVVDTALPF